MLLVSLTVVSLTSCSELMDDLFGGDETFSGATTNPYKGIIPRLWPVSGG